jgi:hypothetical protein
MCVACGQELCKECKGCHNSECERYTEPTEECEIDDTTSQRKRRNNIQKEVP